MSRRDHWGWFKAAPKKPPPERGIKMKRSGATWWGQRWIEALERMSAGYSNRLARGRTYARAGRTHDLVVKAGRVSAKVTGSRATPYTVTIALARLADPVWTAAIAAMAGKAQFAAELLAGQMPREIDAAFEEAGASLFPVRQADLRTECSCPDWANPCKHVAATHYVLGEAFDRDPFLLFELRGRKKEQVLEALRAARTGERADRPARPRKERSSTRSEALATVTLGRLAGDDYEKPRAPLPVLHLGFESPPTPGGVLRQLGEPAGWRSDAAPAELLGPLIRAAADRARSLAMAEPGVEAGADTPAVATAASPVRKKAKARSAATARTARGRAGRTKQKPKQRPAEPATGKSARSTRTTLPPSKSRATKARTGKAAAGSRGRRTKP